MYLQQEASSSARSTAGGGGPSLADCLKLLRGQRDEQKLAGLLLATKFCQGDDAASVLDVYDAVGDRFLHRLLLTGTGKSTSGVAVGEDQEAYLKLSITVLAAFCRLPEIAASEGMVSKVPIVVEIVAESSDQFITEQCYEFFWLVAAASRNGISKFFEHGVMDKLAMHISTLTDGSRALELAVQLLQLVVNQLPFNSMITENLSGMSLMVSAIARLFGELQNALKFDALHMLTAILSSLSNNVTFHDNLRSMASDSWSNQIRVGVTAILQNRVVSAEKLQALLLVDLMMSILGLNWLVEPNQSQNKKLLPVDKFLLLVLECSRVEAAVLLNELAYLKYEASKSSKKTAEMIPEKQRGLAITFSLIEKIIKLISSVSGAEGLVSEHTLMKMIIGLNETISLVLDFLQDSKDHGQVRGDDLLAAIRVVGCYLAETPSASKEKVRSLLAYLLSVEGEDEQSPFYSICFLLPMLCQITMQIDGCKALASVGGHTKVVDCLVNMIGKDSTTKEDGDRIFLACDTLMNLLLNVKELKQWVHISQFNRLLYAIAFWTGSGKDISVLMMASSMCCLIFDLTTEELLLGDLNLDYIAFEKLSQLIVKSLNQGEIKEHSDLYQIISEGYCKWSDRFPHIRDAVENASSI